MGRKTVGWGVVVAILGFASVGAADITVRIVPGIQTVDGKPPRAFFTAALPASQAFTLEAVPSDVHTERATLIVMADDPRCTEPSDAGLGNDAAWGECPQHYTLAMAISGDGANRVLKATVPPLQVDQGYKFSIVETAPIPAARLASLPPRVAAVVTAHVYQSVRGTQQSTPECPAEPTRPSFHLISDIASTLASEVNDALDVDSRHRQTSRVSTEQMMAIARLAARSISATAAAAPPTPAPATAAAPTAAAPTAVPATAAPPVAAPPAAAPPGDPLDELQKSVAIYKTTKYYLCAAQQTRTTRRKALESLKLTELRQTTLRLFDPTQKLWTLDELYRPSTPRPTLILAVAELQVLASATGHDTAFRQAVQDWITVLTALQNAADAKAAAAVVKTRPLVMPTAAEPVFIAAFNQPKVATLGALVTDLDTLALADDAHHQLEEYAARENAPEWSAALTAVNELRQAYTAERKIGDKQQDSAASYVAAELALAARIERVMTDLEPQLHAATQSIEIIGSAGYGATPDAGSYASPDFGVAAAIPVISGAAQDLWLVPYFGLNLYAVPVDRKIAFTNLATEWRHCGWFYRQVLQRTSLTVGFSLNSPSLAGYAVSGPVLNRFPLVAVGYRLTHFIRLTGGAVLYRVASPSPANASTSVAAAPFFGLSVDTDIIDIAKNGFNHL